MKDQVTDLAELRKEIEFQIWDMGTENGLIFDYDGQRGDPDGVTIDHWGEVSDPDNEVQLAVDSCLDVRYVSVNLSREDLLERLLDHLRHRLEVYSIDELKSEVREGVADPRAALFKLALALGDLDSESYDLICTALRSPEMAARNGAARAAVVLRSHELLAPLGEALEREQDAETARILGLAVQVCSAVNLDPL